MPALPPAPDGLPPWMNALWSVLFLAGGFAIWFQSARKAKTPAQQATSALIAADITSTKPFQDIADVLERIETGQGRLEHGQDRIVAAIDRMCAAQDRTTAALERKSS